MLMTFMKLGGTVITETGQNIMHEELDGFEDWRYGMKSNSTNYEVMH